MIRSLGPSSRLEGGIIMYICSSILGLRLTIFLHNYAAVPAAILREIDKIAKFNEQEKTAVLWQDFLDV